MKNGWTIKPLGETCRFIDYRGRTPQKIESGMRLITAKNVKMGFLQTHPMEFVNPAIYDSWMTRGIPEIGDVIFTTEAPLANVAQLDTVEKVVFAQRIIVLQPSTHDLDSTFLKYQLLSDAAQERIHQRGTGATVKGIKASLLKTIEVAFPSVPEQRRIVGILDEAFDGIATAKAAAEKNLQNARELFESYLNGVFTQRGEGWKEKRLSELYTFKNGINFNKTQKVNRGILTIDVRNMYGDDLHVSLGNLYRVNKDVSGEYILKEGDLLVVRSSVKREGVAWATLFRPTDEPITFCGFIIRGRPIVDILPEFAVYFLRRPHTRDELIRRANQSTITNINQSNLGEIRVPLPDMSEQTRIVGDLDAFRLAMLDLESIYRRKLAALDELKKSLLHQAFSGRL